ncbi:MAG: YmfQ family protein [Candidatus Gastranaerophilales bacterium]|nr:YmfQ family protein [Candidatus Gastranaerophilales bacterium]
MSIKDTIINLMNVVYRKDDFINAVSEAVSNVCQNLIDACDIIKNNFFFDSLNDDGAEWWEATLKITPTSTDIEDRQAKIQAKWLSNKHNTVSLIQTVCNSWKNGETDVDFIDGKIQIEFIASYGIPSDFESLQESIEEIKPAHLPLEWVYKYLLKKEIHNVMTKSEMQTYTKNQYCNVGVGE